ncbi:hypothetical protein Tco_0249563 [Tanacetum coccineum]
MLKAHVWKHSPSLAELLAKMCNKKNYVLFTDSECLVLSPNFKLPDERLEWENPFAAKRGENHNHTILHLSKEENDDDDLCSSILLLSPGIAVMPVVVR